MGDSSTDSNVTAHKHVPATDRDLLTLAFAAAPREIRKRLWPDNPQERLNKKIHRRIDGVGLISGRRASRLG